MGVGQFVGLGFAIRLLLGVPQLAFADVQLEVMLPDGKPAVGIRVLQVDYERVEDVEIVPDGLEVIDGIGESRTGEISSLSLANASGLTDQAGKLTLQPITSSGIAEIGPSPTNPYGVVVVRDSRYQVEALWIGPDAKVVRIQLQPVKKSTFQLVCKDMVCPAFRVDGVSAQAKGPRFKFRAEADNRGRFSVPGVPDLIWSLRIRGEDPTSGENKRIYWTWAITSKPEAISLPTPQKFRSVSFAIANDPKEKREFQATSIRCEAEDKTWTFDSYAAKGSAHVFPHVPEGNCELVVRVPLPQYFQFLEMAGRDPATVRHAIAKNATSLNLQIPTSEAFCQSQSRSSCQQWLVDQMSLSTDYWGKLIDSIRLHMMLGKLPPESRFL